MVAFKVLKFILLLLYYLLREGKTQGASPCPRLFVYESRSAELDRWYGIITLLSDTDLRGIWLRIIMDRPALQLGNWFGEVITTDNQEYLIRNKNFHLKANTPQPLRFYLNYDQSMPPPQLQTFRLNAKTVCPENTNAQVTTIKPMLQTSGLLGNMTKPSVFELTTKPVIAFNSEPTSSSEEEEFFPGDFALLNHPQSTINSNDIDYICGTVVVKERPKRQINRFMYPYYYNQYSKHHIYYTQNIGSQNHIYPYIKNFINSILKSATDIVEIDLFQTQAKPLVTYGQSTHEGEYPWHAALYYARGIDLTYICGGSLISKFHVLTVAHCVTKKRTRTTLNSDDLVVYLGKYYLRRFSSSNVQDRQVSSITIHPHYDSHVYKNDIALVKFSEPIDITDYVRPVCLWQESADLTSLINKEGNVVGWGFDESGRVTEHLMKAKMPVVSQEMCLLSFPNFYARFTSSNTYCAGFRNGTSVCNEDSGGGMVFPKHISNQRNKIWQLRGLVSISVAYQNQLKCDTSHYIVFTDIAKYTDWIKKMMA